MRGSYLKHNHDTRAPTIFGILKNAKCYAFSVLIFGSKIRSFQEFEDVDIINWTFFF